MKTESLKQNKKVKQINIYDKILNFDENLDLKEDRNNNSITVYNNEKKILSFNYFQDENSFKLELKGVSNASLISPDLNADNNYLYEFDYSKLLLSDKEYYEFRSVILKINEIYLIITINFNNHCRIEKINEENLKMILHFEKNSKLSFNFSIEKSLNKFYKKFSMKTKLPVWMNNIGFVYDCSKMKDKEFFFTDLKIKFKSDDLIILIKNYDLKGNSIYKNNTDSFIEKLRFNDIKFLFEYDNTVPESISDNFSIMKLRNGESIKEKNKNYIDFFNETGRKNLSDIYQKIIGLNAKGINLKPVNAVFPDENTHEKALCRTGTQMILYKRNIKAGLIILNDIIKNIKKKHDDILFFSNILTDSLNETFFLKTIYKDDLFQILTVIEDIIIQGYYNFGFIISEKSINLLNTNPKLLIILLFSPIVFFEYEIAERIEIRQNIFKFLNDLIILRTNLKIYSETTFNLFKTEGNIPLKLFKEEGKILGFFYGEFLYCSLLQERFFDPYYAIPEGNWYSINDKMIIKGLCNYTDREDKSSYKLFIKENSVILLLKQSILKNNFLPDKLICYIYPDFVNKKKLTVTFDESIIQEGETHLLTHKIILSFQSKELQINYTNDNKINTGRKIDFHIISCNVIINKILHDNNKIIYKKED
ncbi:MAG: hypothetical protein JXB50_09970, partial [Spirochaetes bacterium]|nr:hypothetical protein [Spirochaetota bacterium]